MKIPHTYKERISSSEITKLKENCIFVFGSNLSGRHGKGAAKTALTWGAIWGRGAGIQGRTYGIPTKSHSVYKVLPLNEIQQHINLFIEYAKDFPNLTFLVTEIGCGYAGYKPKQIAPLFEGAINIKNIHLPLSFWKRLKVD